MQAHRTFASRPRKISWPALLALFFAFMCLPSILAATGEVPTSTRAEAAIARNLEPLSTALAAQGLAPGAPVYIVITKLPSTLTLYLEGGDGRYVAARSYPVCAWSGGLGPKYKEGDGKSPEGFYTVTAAQMNPASAYHLSFNLGFPNARDRADGRTGSFLMVHGKCVSIGCYAMTDAAIEEIWTLMDAAFRAGQADIPVHIYPFPMPGGDIPAAAAHHPDVDFWRELAPGWAAFEDTSKPPEVSVSGGRYLVTASGSYSGTQ